MIVLAIDNDDDDDDDYDDDDDDDDDDGDSLYDRMYLPLESGVMTWWLGPPTQKKQN